MWKTLSDWATSFTSDSSSKFTALPLDPQTQNYLRKNVPNSVFSMCEPTPLEHQAKLVVARYVVPRSTYLHDSF